MTAALSDERVIEVWVAYETGAESLKALAERFGITVHALRRLAHDHGWVRAHQDAPERPTSWFNKPCPGLGECPDRAELIARSWMLAQKQIDDIEMQFADIGDGENRKRLNAVQYARALGVMVRVLKDLAALDRTVRSQGGDATEQGGVSSDGLRDELARRLAAIETGRNTADTVGQS